MENKISVKSDAEGNAIIVVGDAKGAEAKIKAEIAKTNTEINALYDNPRMEMNERQRAITKKRAHLAMLNRELEVEKGIAEDNAGDAEADLTRNWLNSMRNQLEIAAEWLGKAIGYAERAAAEPLGKNIGIQDISSKINAIGGSIKGIIREVKAQVGKVGTKEFSK